MALAVTATGSWLVFEIGGEWWNIVACILLCVLFFPLAAQLHELGHKLFGLFVKMDVKLGKFALFSPSSCTVMPKSSKNIRRSFIVTACGGIAVNFVFAAAGIALMCCANEASIGLFVAPSSLYLLIINAVPTGSGEGATDMRMILDAAKNTEEWQVLERVLTIQGRLYEGTPIEDIEEDLFFSVPQIAEDEPAFIMLVSLRADYYAAKGDGKSAEKWSARLRQLIDDYAPQSVADK